MKFLVSKDIHSNLNFTLLLKSYALMLLGYLIGDLVYLAHFFGHTPELVLATLKGDPDQFIEPLSLIALLEHFHVSLFLALLALFTTMAILLRLDLSHNHKRSVIITAMASLLLAFLSLIGLYFSGPLFVYGFMVFTVLWHLGGSYALVLSLFQLWKKA